MPKSPALRFNHFQNFFVCLLVLVVLSIASLNIYLYLNRKPVVLGVQTSPLSERQYWQKVAAKAPTYRDAWVEIAKLDHEMGNQKYAEVALTKAKNIDPNSLTILDVEKTLLSQN